ncbi:S8 family serine peptidase [Gallaecimonas sp. GXIMD4217]|uniref:S8 family serine peptidase n=1 Tax=Gallaecimonas sp. GXIMD4217 TaxID=3131927 RepID=UPI00311ADA35
MTAYKFHRLRALFGGAVLYFGSHAALALSLDPQLAQLAATADTGDKLEVIVTFEGDGPLGPDQRQLLTDLGLSGLTLQSLPIAGVLATPAQLAALQQLDGIRSLYHNQPLAWDNAEATALTGVDRLRLDPQLRSAGLPYSGRGIGVVINDSGVDGSHNDIRFPEHAVQNVLAQTNLRSFSDTLPISYQQDVINTDIGGGHGSHVAGIIGGNGAMSSGRQEGVAPGADLIGYGSGAGLFILDTLGGFDYALTHQYDYNIRVISNSFGSTGDIGSDFDPDHPTNVATKALADRGVVVVFSAGNSGSGEGTITGNFKKAPWVITVAAGDKQGRLADFSSRGVRDREGETEVDGTPYVWVDRPTITAPGVDIVSVRASTSGPLGALSLSGDLEAMPESELPYYTVMSGTSMAAPHVSGIVALMLEANPGLGWREVKAILQDTATNMPGYESWEVGAGYVNAHAAVRAAAGFADAYGDTTKHNRSFHAGVDSSLAGQSSHQVPFSPVGEPEQVPFEVAEGISLISASARIGSNTLALVLTDPDGIRYGSGIALPVLGENVAATAPGKPGTWTLSLRGVGSVSGVPLDPTGASNGIGLPETITATVRQQRIDGYNGIDDVFGHPAEAFALKAVAEQLMDARTNGFEPDARLTRAELADYLTLAGAARQSIAGNAGGFDDVAATLAGAVNAVTSPGAALKDLYQRQQALVPALAEGRFGPGGQVERSLLAYSLIQSLGLEAQAQDAPEQLHVDHLGQAVPVVDSDSIPAQWRGHVQLALDLGLLAPRFAVEQGPFELTPTLKAYFEPAGVVSRGDFAAAAVRLQARYLD